MASGCRRASGMRSPAVATCDLPPLPAADSVKATPSSVPALILRAPPRRRRRSFLPRAAHRHARLARSRGDHRAQRDRGAGELRAGRFDAVLADLVLPSVGGIELMRALHQRSPDSRRRCSSPAPPTRAPPWTPCAKAPPTSSPSPSTRPRCSSRWSAPPAARTCAATRLLDENLEFIKHQALYRRLPELLTNLDLERLQERALAISARLRRAIGRALGRGRARRARLKAYRGLWIRAKLPVRVDGKRGPLAEGIAARRPFTAAGPGKDFFLPLWAGGDSVGLRRCLATSSPARSPARTRPLRERCRTLPRRRCATRDASWPSSASGCATATPARTTSPTSSTTRAEAYKARRYGRSFSLLTLGIDNLEALRAHLNGDELRTAIAPWSSR